MGIERSKSKSHWQLGCPHAARHEVARMLIATGKYDRTTAERLAREAENRANARATPKEDTPDA